MSGTITIGGTLTGLATGNKTFNVSITASSANGTTTDLIIANGDNTITVPANCLGCVITFPSTNTNAMKLKGVGGDTGLVISKTGSHLLTFESTPPASFVLNSAGLHTGYTQISFF